MLDFNYFVRDPLSNYFMSLQFTCGIFVATKHHLEVLLSRKLIVNSVFQYVTGASFSALSATKTLVHDLVFAITCSPTRL